MTKEKKELLGLLVFVAAVVWAGFRALPNVTYRYDHPELTDTQLHLIFLSSLSWWDLIPAVLAVIGMILIYRESK